MNGISFVIPVYNEQGNIRPLFSALTQARNLLPCFVEIIFVDDASQDTSYDILQALTRESQEVYVYRHTTRQGQTHALFTGIQCARCSVVATLDADQEHSPVVFAELYRELCAGYDCILGWRKKRDYKTMHERIYGWIGRTVLRLFLNHPLHDPATPLRLCKRELLLRIPLRKGYHRMIPLFFKKTVHLKEVPISLSKREYGKSKYGFAKGFECMLSMGTFLLCDHRRNVK